MSEEKTAGRRIALLAAALHAVAWELVEYETDTSDRGISEEHYRDALERAKTILPTLVPQQVTVEPEGAEVEYRVFDHEGDLWASTNSLAEARHYLAQEPGGRIERAVWLPVELEDAS